MKGRSAQEALGLRFDGLPFASKLALAFALAALWLLGRRYGGFVHDASIYVLQGLRVLDPASFAGDLFFLHGAQDAYTVFPRIYALLIDILGAGKAAMAVTLAGQLAFLAAAAALIVRLPVGAARWWSLALLAVVSGYYGGGGVFRLAEPFSTARTLSEPLVLAALACTLASRHYLALAALAGAALLHPLVAAPGIVVVFLWHAAARPRILWLAPVFCGLIPAIALLWPMATQRFDPPWLAAVLERSPHLFVGHWAIPDWARLIWGLCVAWLGARFVERPARRLVAAVAAASLAGIAASWIAVDLLESAFIAGLQLWRAHWLLHFFAIVLVPVAAAGLWRSGNASRLAAACVAASCCFGRAELLAGGLLAASAVVLDAVGRYSSRRMGEKTFRLLLLAVICTGVVGLTLEVQSRLPFSYGATRALPWTDYLGGVVTVGGLLPLAGLLWLLACSRFPLAGAGVAAVAAAVAIAAWDARTPWARFIDQADAIDRNPFRSALPRGAQVFWPGTHGRTWLVLGTPTWFSADQGAGIVFNRQTAIAYAERKRASIALLSAIENCEIDAKADCRIDARLVHGLCERRDGPDYLVLNAPVEGYDGIEWHLPADIGQGRQSLFLSDCRAFAGNEKGRR